ncbi:MAG: hypothetical protein ABSD58_20280 [Verrucomicrobiia bacterium]|jgi:hypothetical protein
MVISQKQQEANRRNAQKSTGPTTLEGKAAASLNAVTYGLRTRKLLIAGENIADYWQLWDGLETEWQPETQTERLYLEQMSTSQWLLARMAATENRIYEIGLPLHSQFDLLDRVAKHRTRLERSFSAAMHELKQLQKERQAKRQPPVQAKPTKQSAQPQALAFGYPAADAAEVQPAFCAPATTDSR